MNKFSVQSKGVFLIQGVDYQTALITAKSHVEKTTQACHIIALASPHRVWVTVFQAGLFPLAEHDAGMVARHYVELGREAYKVKCDAEIEEFRVLMKKAKEDN